MAFPTDLPTQTEPSLGQSKTDATAYTSTTSQVSASIWNRLVQTVIAVCTEVGKADGTTVGSLRAAFTPSVLEGLVRAAFAVLTANVSFNGKQITNLAAVNPTSGTALDVAKLSDGTYAFAVDNTGQVTLRNDLNLTDAPLIVEGAGLSVVGDLGAAGTSTLGNLTVQGLLWLQGIVSDLAVASSQNNYAPTGAGTANILRLSGSARSVITGLTGGASGRMLILWNVGSKPIEGTREDSASTAAYRFAEGFCIAPGGAVILHYDLTSSRWRTLSNRASRKVANANAAITASAYTIKPEDELILVDTTSNAVALTCPALDGRDRIIKKVGGGTNGITLVRTGSEKIEGVAATYTLPGSATAWASATPQAWGLYDDSTDRYVA